MITKFARLLGFNGFQKFKISLSRTSSHSQTDAIIFDEISLEDDVSSICKKIYHNNIDALMDSLSILDYDDIQLFTETRNSTKFCESLHSRIAELSLIDSLFLIIASKYKALLLKN